MSPTPSQARDAAYAEQLLAVFEAQNDQGQYVFEDADVRHLVPALALMSGWKPEELFDDTPLSRLMEEFRGVAGLDEDADKAAWDEAAAVYYQKSPPNAELLAQLRTAMGNKPAS